MRLYFDGNIRQIICLAARNTSNHMPMEGAINGWIERLSRCRNLAPGRGGDSDSPISVGSPAGASAGPTGGSLRTMLGRHRSGAIFLVRRGSISPRPGGQVFAEALPVRDSAYRRHCNRRRKREIDGTCFSRGVAGLSPGVFPCAARADKNILYDTSSKSVPPSVST